jgi:hypothetical protein
MEAERTTSIDDASTAPSEEPPPGAPSLGGGRGPALPGSPPFYERSKWLNLWMPLATHTIPILAATYLISSGLKSAEHEDRIKSVGIAAQVEIVKNDYIQVRGLATALRRMSPGIDDALLARARATAPARATEEAIKLLADLDDALYFARLVDDRSASKSSANEYAGVIRQARGFTRALHDCLAPIIVTEEVRGQCAGVIERYRRPTADGMDPALALHLVDNAMLVLRYQLAR